MLPKRMVDLRAVEVNRFLKLSTDTVTSISFHVPRADYLKEYFHNDIYLPVRSCTESNATVYDWKNIANIPSNDTIFNPIMESLKPENMMNVTEKPVSPLPSESNSKISSYRASIQRQEEENKQKEEKFSKLQQLAFQNAQYHKNSSGPMKIGGVVVSNPQLKESNTNKKQDDDSDEEVDWS